MYTTAFSSNTQNKQSVKMSSRSTLSLSLVICFHSLTFSLETHVNMRLYFFLFFSITHHGARWNRFELDSFSPLLLVLLVSQWPLMDVVDAAASH